MKQPTNFKSSLLLLAGVSSILGGSLIIIFAIIADGNGLFFIPGILTGGEVQPWLKNVQANPGLSKIIMILPAIGFSCFFIAGNVMYQYIAENYWQKKVFIAGYAIGVPYVVVVFIIQLSLMNYVLLHYGKESSSDTNIIDLTKFFQYFFHISNNIFGPFFIIVLGTAMMAWATLKAKILPKWLCYWAIACGVLLSLSFLGVVIPLFEILGFAAPLHMLWFIVFGIMLLRRATEVQ